MKTRAIPFGTRVDLVSDESLATHLRMCAASLGAEFRIRYVAEAVHAFVAPRFVTTVSLSCVVLFSAAMAF